MTKNKTIIDIARYHKEWIAYACKNSLSTYQKENPEDFVQEAYIKLLKQKTFDPIEYYKADGKINKKYFFLTLKSILINEHKKRKIQTVNLTTDRLRTATNIIDEIDINPKLELVFNKIEKTINDMYWFDKKMMNLYVYHIPTMLSIRKLSNETTISSQVVFKTLKRAKLTIKKEAALEYKNYYGKTA
jgi:hypothetical protein|tara:strand:+ start:725 stop:1288 length:564 start_codon:yes stop_codon:yes gene_type:complete